ncbi:MAG: hypothetical protein P1V97_16390, partial [Planctomycetota bacterium]|nr:hypothetical protein [Planctomycetota bacterium]
KSKKAALWQFLAWHREVPQSWRVGLIQLLLFLIGLLCFALQKRHLSKTRGRRILIGIGVVGLMSLASLVIESASNSEREGVIIAESVIGRNGPHAYSYQESFTQPLSSGVEFQWVEDRDGWSLIQFPDEKRTWVPHSSIELILKDG